MITTDRQIQALKPRDRVYWEAVSSPHGGGLALRVQPTGTKAWFFRFRFNGHQDAYSFGRYPTLRLKEARDLHGTAKQLLEEGINPKRVKQESRAQNLASWTMAELFEKWIEIYATSPSIRTKRPPSELVVEQTRWRWKFYLEDLLGDLLAQRVDTRRISATVAEVAATHSREQARKCLTMLKAMFDFAEARGQVEGNPAAVVSAAKAGAAKSAPRERVLSLGELRRLWLAVDESRISAQAAAAIKLLILTGQRRGELIKMQSKDLDLEAKVWEIPAADTKSRQGHVVYLSDAAIGVLEDMPLHERFIFHKRNLPDEPMGPNVITTAVARLQGRKTRKRDESAPLADMAPFSVHDLRRSFATGLGEYCAVPPHIVERMLSHAPEDALVATYQRAEYREEQRRAWQAWGELIESQVVNETMNVVPLRGRG